MNTRVSARSTAPNRVDLNHANRFNYITCTISLLFQTQNEQCTTSNTHNHNITQLVVVVRRPVCTILVRAINSIQFNSFLYRAALFARSLPISIFFHSVFFSLHFPICELSCTTTTPWLRSWIVSTTFGVCVRGYKSVRRNKCAVHIII